MKSVNYVLVLLFGFMSLMDAFNLDQSTLAKKTFRYKPGKKKSEVCFNIEEPVFSSSARKHEPCSTFQLNFPHENHTAVALLHNTIPSYLDALSICHWTKVLNPIADYLSVISYRSTEHGNDIWTGFGGGKIYFQRYKTYPGYAHNITVGKWTHNCFTWSSANGEMVYYESGLKIFETTGVATLRKVPPTGVFFLGQEGNLNSKWSFKGDITEVHVWDYVISQDEVNKMLECSPKLEGNIISWRSNIVLQPENGAKMSPANPCVHPNFV